MDAVTEASLRYVKGQVTRNALADLPSKVYQVGFHSSPVTRKKPKERDRALGQVL